MSIRTTSVVRERLLRVAGRRAEGVRDDQILDDKCADVYRRHPFYKPPDLGQMLRQLVESPDLKRATNLR